MENEAARPHHNTSMLLLERAKALPDRVAVSITDPHRRITYQQLRERALQFAIQLRNRGVGRGSRVVLATKFPTNSYSAMIAIGLLGATWLKASRALGQKGLNLKYILIDTDDPLYSADRRTVRIMPEWTVTPEGDLDALAASFPLNVSGDDLAVFAESSGTTGTAKLIPVSYESRWRRLVSERTNEGFETLISANMFPVNSAGTSMTDMRVMQAGGTVVLGGDYEDWRSRGVNMLTASPAHVVGRVFSQPAPSPDLQKITQLWVRGSKTSPQFLEQAFAYFDEIYIGYGATEVGGIAQLKVTRDNLAESSELLGTPFPYAEAQIVDEQDQPLPPDTTGIVRVRSHAMVTGYFNNPEATEKAFRHGWFYPGDLGSIRGDGMLMIDGRANDQFNLAGIKVGATIVDAAVEAVPGVKRAMAFLERDVTGIDVLSALIVVQDDVDENELAVQIVSDCLERLGKSRTPRRIYAADDLPMNDNGKAVRGEASRSVEQYRRLL